MEHDREAVYLTKRTGFVRIALQHGVHPENSTIPKFCQVVFSGIFIQLESGKTHLLCCIVVGPTERDLQMPHVYINATTVCRLHALPVLKA